MSLCIHKVNKNDYSAFINLSCKLTRYNYFTRPEHERTYDLNERLEIRKSWVRDTLEEAEKDENMLLLISYINDNPVGYAKAFIYEDSTGLLDELFIEEHYRGMGIGRSLIQETEKWMKDKQTNKMIIKVYSWNTDSITFYEKEGFDKHIITYTRDIK